MNSISSHNLSTVGSSPQSKKRKVEISTSLSAKKQKRENTTRIMTWNAHGLADYEKRQKLDQFQKDLNIDLLFIQEGNDGYHNALAEKYDESTAFPISDKDRALSLLFNKTNEIRPNGGQARGTPYNVKFDSGKWEMAKDEDEVNYAENAAIRRWVTEPIDKAMKEEKITIVTSGRPGRPQRTTLNAEGEILKEVKQQVQNRVNMLGQQRPKCLKSKENNRKIFFFHSPLGRDVTMKGVGLDRRGKTNFSTSAATGSGGQLAPAANALFRLAICGYDENTQQVNPTKDKMKDIIYLGDMNVKPEGIENLFPSMNRATESKNELCHILTHPEHEMTIVSTRQNDANVGQSDHDWVIVDIENPKNFTSEPRSGGGAGSSESKAEEKKQPIKKKKEEEEGVEEASVSQSL